VPANESDPRVRWLRSQCSAGYSMTVTAPWNSKEMVVYFEQLWRRQPMARA
jgi:hypothetical protein